MYFPTDLEIFENGCLPDKPPEGCERLQLLFPRKFAWNAAMARDPLTNNQHFCPISTVVQSALLSNQHCCPISTVVQSALLSNQHCCPISTVVQSALLSNQHYCPINIVEFMNSCSPPPPLLSRYCVRSRE
ncbi:hypothetical protein TNCV_3857051 [Trichonephila clavipes]|nr:hypothetical protein TNCV_3857051 [Trichonephila clavipes]